MYIVSYIHRSSSIFIHAMLIRLVRILGIIMRIISKMVIIVIVHTYYQEAKKEPRNREAKKGRSHESAKPSSQEADKP